MGFLLGDEEARPGVQLPGIPVGGPFLPPHQFGAQAPADHLSADILNLLHQQTQSARQKLLQASMSNQVPPPKFAGPNLAALHQVAGMRRPPHMPPILPTVDRGFFQSPPRVGLMPGPVMY